MLLEDQVFQGIVLGPPLWNVFFADVVAMLSPNFGKIFTDVLNVFHEFDLGEPQHRIFGEVQQCRDNVHAWGRRNRVEYDAAKEYFIVVHPSYGVGEDFELLRLVFDNKLRVASAVTAILKKARPKFQMLMRSRPYYDYADMILQFKTHILGIFEANIGGIYHATPVIEISGPFRM